MTPDEMDKKIEFILEMQAQFEADAHSLRANAAETTRGIEDLRATVAETTRSVEGLRAYVADVYRSVESLRITVSDIAEVVERHDHWEDRFDAQLQTVRVWVTDLAAALIESARLSDERMTRLDERMARQSEAGKITDERLNALISVVERHITGPDHAPRTQ